jgi:hypothetical protein
VNRYIKLVLMEINRFRFVLASLFGITAVVQIASLLWTVSREVNKREELAMEQPTMAFVPLSSGWAVGSIAVSIMLSVLLCTFVLLAYALVIWYRDWVGRSAFIYRLLMLPTARRHIYLAKATTVIVLFLAFVSFQFVLLCIHHLIAKLLIPAAMWEPSPIMNVLRSVDASSLLLPHNGQQWLYNYGLGIIAVFVLFTAIMLERCYGRPGILYGVLYAGCCSALIALPIVFQYEITLLYPAELIALFIVVCLLVLGLSVWLGMRLIAKKITV